MKATVKRTAFAETAAWVSQAIPRNPQAPVLSGMLIRATAGGLLLTGFNGETSHAANVDADVFDHGEVLVLGKFITSLAAAMKGAIIGMAVEDNRLVITSGSSTYRAGLMPIREYPQVPAFPKHVGTIHADSLIQALGTTEHAVSRNPNLVAITALNIVGSAGELTVNATDIYRVAHARAAWADASGVEFVANVPAVALSSAVKGLRGEVEIGSDGTGFALSDGSRIIISRCISEQYPAVGRVLERQPILFMDCDKAPLIEALKRALIVARDDTEDQVRVSVQFSDMLIRISALGETSDGSEEIEADAGMGEEVLTLRFSAVYLEQALSACPSERVRFGLINEKQQMSIAPIGADGTTDRTACLVVMPRGDLR